MGQIDIQKDNFNTVYLLILFEAILMQTRTFRGLHRSFTTTTYNLKTITCSWNLIQVNVGGKQVGCGLFPYKLRLNKECIFYFTPSPSVETPGIWVFIFINFKKFFFKLKIMKCLFYLNYNIQLEFINTIQILGKGTILKCWMLFPPLAFQIISAWNNQSPVSAKIRLHCKKVSTIKILELRNFQMDGFQLERGSTHYFHR